MKRTCPLPSRHSPFRGETAAGVASLSTFSVPGTVLGTLCAKSFNPTTVLGGLSCHHARFIEMAQRD